MNLICDTVGDIMTVRVVDPHRIDAACAIQFKDSMRAATKYAPDRVVLDMANVEFVDSSGLGAIVAVMKQLSGQATLELAALTENVQKVFHLTRMDTVFKIHASAQQAVAEGRPG